MSDERYRLIRQLRPGPPIDAWCAEWLSTGQSVVVEFLHPAATSDEVIRRERLLTLLVGTSHPNLPRLVDVDTSADGRPFIVVEEPGTRTLRDVILDEGCMSATRAGRVMAQVLDALVSIHEAAAVHRDIRPGAISYTASQLADHVVVGGFERLGDSASGARTGRSQTVAGELAPVPYTPPEVLSGEPFRPHGDIYAWGLTLCELITGHPVVHGTVLETRAQHLSQRPHPIPPQAPPGLGLIIAKSVAKSPGERYQTAAEAFSALTSWLEVSGASFPTKMPQTLPPGLAAAVGPKQPRRWWVILAIVAVAGASFFAGWVGGSSTSSSDHVFVATSARPEKAAATVSETGSSTTQDGDTASLGDAAATASVSAPPFKVQVPDAGGQKVGPAVSGPIASPAVSPGGSAPVLKVEPNTAKAASARRAIERPGPGKPFTDSELKRLGRGSREYPPVSQRDCSQGSFNDFGAAQGKVWARPGFGQRIDTPKAFYIELPPSNFPGAQGTNAQLMLSTPDWPLKLGKVMAGLVIDTGTGSKTSLTPGRNKGFGVEVLSVTPHSVCLAVTTLAFTRRRLVVDVAIIPGRAKYNDQTKTFGANQTAMKEWRIEERPGVEPALSGGGVLCPKETLAFTGQTKPDGAKVQVRPSADGTNVWEMTWGIHPSKLAVSLGAKGVGRVSYDFTPGASEGAELVGHRISPIEGGFCGWFNVRTGSKRNLRVVFNTRLR